MNESTPSANKDAAASLGRPEEGSLARGVWEAPPWAFYASAAVVVLAALVFWVRLARSSGLVGLVRRRRPHP
jgi:hypothetical protein